MKAEHANRNLVPTYLTLQPQREYRRITIVDVLSFKQGIFNLHKFKYVVSRQTAMTEAAVPYLEFRIRKACIQQHGDATNACNKQP